MKKIILFLAPFMLVLLCGFNVKALEVEYFDVDVHLYNDITGEEFHFPSIRLGYETPVDFVVSGHIEYHPLYNGYYTSMILYTNDNFLRDYSSWGQWAYEENSYWRYSVLSSRFPVEQCSFKIFVNGEEYIPISSAFGLNVKHFQFGQNIPLYDTFVVWGFWTDITNPLDHYFDNIDISVSSSNGNSYNWAVDWNLLNSFANGKLITYEAQSLLNLQSGDIVKYRFTPLKDGQYGHTVIIEYVYGNVDTDVTLVDTDFEGNEYYILHDNSNSSGGGTSGYFVKTKSFPTSGSIITILNNFIIDDDDNPPQPSPNYVQPKPKPTPPIGEQPKKPDINLFNKVIEYYNGFNLKVDTLFGEYRYMPFISDIISAFVIGFALVCVVFVGVLVVKIIINIL